MLKGTRNRLVLLFEQIFLLAIYSQISILFFSDHVYAVIIILGSLFLSQTIMFNPILVSLSGHVEQVILKAVPKCCFIVLFLTQEYHTPQPLLHLDQGHVTSSGQ